PGVPPEQQLAQTPTNRYWIDRARVFQTAMSQLTSDFGTVDLAIGDITPEDTPAGPNEVPANYPTTNPRNYCERQGRWNVGCLPGARHTLNKQLMRAILGTFDPAAPDDPSKDKAPDLPNISVETLSEVDVVRAVPGGGYEVQYIKRQEGDLSKTTNRTVTADIVIVAAGCLGTSEIMLSSRHKGALPNLSGSLRVGFSTTR